MVLKLIKNDIKTLGKYLFFLWMGLIMILISQRVLTLFISSDNEWMSMIAINTVSFMILTIVALFIVTYIACIIYFYKSMFTGEGYLTFTLPVKTSQIVFSKIITSVLFMFVPICVTFLLGLSYLTSIESWREMLLVLKAFIDFGWTPTLVVIWCFNLLIGIFGSFTELFLGLALGQMANRNKIIFSILSIIGIRMVKQIFYSIVVVFFALQDVFYFQYAFGIEEFTYVSVFVIIAEIIHVTVEWLLINYLCKNKLNLE